MKWFPLPETSCPTPPETPAESTKVLLLLELELLWINNLVEEVVVEYSVGLSKDFNLGSWSANGRVSYSYRDEVAYDDANIGIIGEQRILDMGVDFYSPSEKMSVGVYGKNMNDYVKHGNISPVSWGSFAPLMTGKVVGIELVYDF